MQAPAFRPRLHTGTWLYVGTRSRVQPWSHRFTCADVVMVMTAHVNVPVRVQTWEALMGMLIWMHTHTTRHARWLKQASTGKGACAAWVQGRNVRPARHPIATNDVQLFLMPPRERGKRVKKTRRDESGQALNTRCISSQLGCRSQSVAHHVATGKRTHTHQLPAN